MREKIKILFLSAAPSGYPSLESDVELREAEANIRAGLHPDRFDVAAVSGVRLVQLQETLLRHWPHILHFSGHGERTKGILLEDDYGITAPISGERLAELFAILRGRVRIVFLNACSTKATARAFQHFVEYTVAMSRPIPDASAVAFATAFYNAIALGQSVPGAFALGASQLRILKLPGSTVPELFVGAGVPLEETAPPVDEPKKALIEIHGSTITGSVITVNGDGNLVIAR